MILAEGWRNSPEVRGSGLLLPGIDLLISRSRIHWDHEEKRWLLIQRRVLIVLGLVVYVTVRAFH